jgi:tyrosinase
MVDRFITDPLELPPLSAEDAEHFRADLVFYGVDHSGDSYHARIYLEAPDADQSSGRDHPSYAGSYSIFGHGGCFGDQGHCDVPGEHDRDPFDIRPPHQLRTHTKVVTVTDALRRLLDVTKPEQTVRVTVVAETVRDRSNQVLAFDAVRLAVYT